MNKAIIDQLGVNGDSTRRVCIIALVCTLTISALLTFILPRPFYILSNDYDNGHYYNIRAYYHGLPIHNVEHPGTPVFVLGRLLMNSTTEKPENVQSYLTQMYSVVGLVTIISLALFFLLVLRPFPASIAVLALASLTTWPSFLTFLNYYCTDSFVLPIGLIALAGLWRVLGSFPKPKFLDLVLAGVACGLALSIKLTFIPFVSAIEIAIFISVLRAKIKLGQKILKIFILLLTTISTFLIAIIPVIHRLDEIVNIVRNRSDVKPGGFFWIELRKSFIFLIKEQPVFVVFFTASILIMAVTTIRFFKRPVRSLGRLESRFDGLAGIIFFFLVSVSFVYSLACAAGDLKYYDSVGHSLRNASPTVLVVPFAILLFWRFTGLREEHRSLESHRLGHIILWGAVIVAVASVSFHLVSRQVMINKRNKMITETKTRFKELKSRYGTVAFWDGSPGILMGEPSFHFWGDYKYANRFFQKELRSIFPETTWLHLRDFGYFLQKNSKQQQISNPPNSIGSDQRPFWRRCLRIVYYKYWLVWKRRFPVFPEAPPELYDGENEGLMPGIFAFPEREAKFEVYDRLGWSQTDLHARMQQRFGPLDLWKETIGGLDWILLSPSEKKPKVSSMSIEALHYSFSRD